MTRLIAISQQQYADKSWSRFTSYEFAAKDPVVPLVSVEIARAALSLPMGFVKHQDRFLLVAALSLTPGTNLFVAPNGKWLGEYVPSAFRSYPFRLARGGEKNDLMLCVDEDSGLVYDDPTAGEPFFEGSGELSKPVKDIMNFLSQVEQNRTATATTVAALADADLLTEWPLKVRIKEKEKPVTGLYRIDEAKLTRLEDDAFLKLREAQALPVAYAQLVSMGNIRMLEKIAKARSEMKPREPDIKAVFGDDDIITFQ